MYVKHEGYSLKSDFVDNKAELNKKAYKAGLKQLLYVVGFTFSVGFAVALRFTQLFRKTPFEATLAQAILSPLQGFWNCLIYLYLQGFFKNGFRGLGNKTKVDGGKDSLDNHTPTNSVVKSRTVDNDEVDL